MRPQIGITSRKHSRRYHDTVPVLVPYLVYFPIPHWWFLQNIHFDLITSFHGSAVRYAFSMRFVTFVAVGALSQWVLMRTNHIHTYKIQHNLTYCSTYYLVSQYIPETRGGCLDVMGEKGVDRICMSYSGLTLSTRIVYSLSLTQVLFDMRRYTHIYMHK